MIVFLHVGPDISQAQMMVNSAKRFGHHCVQLTDMDSPAVEGAGCVRFKREGEGIMYFRAKCYAAYNEHGIYMDTDMLIKHDLFPILSLDYDVAITKRTHDIIDPNGVNVGGLMPYNGGFVAVKDKTFWPEVYELMGTMGSDNQEWYGDQLALAHACKKRRVVELPVSIYNRTTKKEGLDVSGAWVLHFKGKGKEVMHGYQ